MGGLNQMAKHSGLFQGSCDACCITDGRFVVIQATHCLNLVESTQRT